MDNKKVIISCNVNGDVFTKEDSKYIPITPEEIAKEAILAAKAGAAIVNINAREEDGSSSMNVKKLKEIIDMIKKESDVIINVDLSGLQGHTYEGKYFKDINAVMEYMVEKGIYPSVDILMKYCKDVINKRLEPLLSLKPELATIKAGCYNTHKGVYFNIYKMMEAISVEMRNLNIKPKIECYCEGMIDNTERSLLKNNLINEPIFFELGLGEPAGIESTVNDLIHMVDLLPKRSIWSAYAKDKGNREHTSIMYAALAMGGNIRTGLGDSIYIGKGVLAKSNVEFIETAIKAIKELEKEPATPNEVRQVLGLSIL